MFTRAVLTLLVVGLAQPLLAAATIRVPEDHKTIRAAVDVRGPFGLVEGNALKPVDKK